ncbi:MAG: CoA transferase subunit A [Chloroflexota bacterium]|nr:MAG: CoA transferase subunit A [Chloroflexota bacterium]
MIDRRISLDEAVALVADGDTLGLGGLTIYRRPIAFTRALISRPDPPRDLTLLAYTAGLASDMLVGAELVSRVRTCYFGLEIFGLAPMFGLAVDQGRLRIVEESEASLANGLRASVAGVGFMPSRAWLGTEMFGLRPDVASVQDPYTGQQLTAFPAISCDVAVIHVLRADPSGNSVLGGNPTVDNPLAAVAKTTIITAEEIVEDFVGEININAHDVTAVVHCPRGAWPTSCYPLYPVDGEEILRYISACNDGAFDDYLDSSWTTPQTRS